MKKYPILLTMLALVFVAMSQTQQQDPAKPAGSNATHVGSNAAIREVDPAAPAGKPVMVSGVQVNQADPGKTAVNHPVKVEQPAGTAKTTTATAVKPRTVYTEGKLKGQPIYTPSNNHPAANPAKQAQEKAAAERMKKAHPASVTGTTAAQKAAYPAKREAELKVTKKQ